jgi:hypothetical protein
VGFGQTASGTLRLGLGRIPLVLKATRHPAAGCHTRPAQDHASTSVMGDNPPTVKVILPRARARPTSLSWHRTKVRQSPRSLWGPSSQRSQRSTCLAGRHSFSRSRSLAPAPLRNSSRLCLAPGTSAPAGNLCPL